MNNCFGCYSIRLSTNAPEVLNYCYLNTILEYDNDDGGCPCTSCIVKAMCNVGCPEFEDYKKALRSRIVWKRERLGYDIH